MSQISDFDYWKQTHIEAKIWYCGDDECGCHQPQIDIITPNTQEGYPWIKREALWQGTFASNFEDIDIMKQELKEAVKKYRELGWTIIDLEEIYESQR